jgi:PD-(D/E)XK nuclease superfamily
MQLDFGPSVVGWVPDPETRDKIIADGGTPNQPYVLCGHLDRVVLFNEEPFTMDHKSTKSTVSTNFFERFDPDNQMSLYTLASRVIFKTPVRGVIIDAAQIAVGFTKFTRGFAYRTEGQLEEWTNDLRFWLAQAESFAIANYWPMNDKACFLCNFKGICSKDPGVRERFLEADFKREFWNPLKTR